MLKVKTKIDLIRWDKDNKEITIPAGTEFELKHKVYVTGYDTEETDGRSIYFGAGEFEIVKENETSFPVENVINHNTSKTSVHDVFGGRLSELVVKFK